MNPTSLIELAAGQGVELYVEHGRLKYRALPQALTPELKQQIGAHREAIVACLTAAGTREAGAEPLDGGAPLSFAQQRLWFIDALDGGSCQYNMPLLLRLDGPLDRAAMAAAIGDVVERHQVLRTRYRLHDGQLRQVVQAAAPFCLPEEDLTELAQCRRYNCAMSALIIGALGVWLHKLTRQKRMLMGMLSNARAQGYLLDVPGCFIEDTLFIADIEVEDTIVGVALKAQEQIAKSSSHSIYSLAKVLADLDVSTDALGTVFLNYIAERGGDQLERFAPRHEEGGFPQMDINIAIAQFSNSVAFDCQYKLDIFRPETIESIMQYFLGLLDDLSEDFSITVASIREYARKPGGAHSRMPTVS